MAVSTSPPGKNTATANTRRGFSVFALATAVALHVGLAILLIYGLPSAPKKIADSKAVPLEIILAPQPLPMAPTAAAPTPIREEPIERPVPKPRKPTPVKKEKPLPQKKAPVPPPTPQAAAPVAEPIRTPSAPEVPQSAAAPPPRTEVSIDATGMASNRKPAYPVMSQRYCEFGTVLLRIHVSADGRAEKVELKKTSGYPLLDESAMDAVRSWRFRPATVGGKPIAEWYLQEIPFLKPKNC